MLSLAFHWLADRTIRRGEEYEENIETQRPDNKWMSEGTHIMSNCMQNCTAHCFVAILSFHSVSYLSFSILNFFFYLFMKVESLSFGKIKEASAIFKMRWVKAMFICGLTANAEPHAFHAGTRAKRTGTICEPRTLSTQHNQRVLAFIRSVIIICCRRIGTFVRIERQWNGTEKNKEKQVTRLIFAERLYCACISCRIETRGEGGGCCFAAVN